MGGKADLWCECLVMSYVTRKKIAFLFSWLKGARPFMKTAEFFCKGVSALEMCMDYFALPGNPGKNCQKIVFPPIHLKWHAADKNLVSSQKTGFPHGVA